MRVNLSQATHSLRTTGFVLLAAFSIGCNETGEFTFAGGDSATAEEDGWTMPWSERAESHRGQNAPFDWPVADDHPVIEIDIKGDGGTVAGTVAIELMPELAPKTVRQILEWVESDFYVGTTFHRVIDDFMIQGGDPNSRDRLPRNDGQGGPGFLLEDEITRAPFERGVVGMGNKGRANSAGSQFFIMQADQPSLRGRYTVIGRVASGMEVVDQIMQVEIDKVGRWGPKDRPVKNVVMAKIVELEGDARLAALATQAAAPADSGNDTAQTSPELAQSPRD